MKRLFGTDGIRGVANQHPLDIETALKVGRAVAAFFDGRANGTGRVLIGRDTRISGDMLVSAIAAGICSMGKDVFLAGIIPTPAVAFLTAAEGFDAGIVVSASHNPFYDNGIKLFDKDGYKLSDDVEANLEQAITDSANLYNKSNSIQKTGQVHYLDDALVRYQQFLANCYPCEGRPLEGMRLVVDCSNGAASRLAPALFEDLGAMVRTMGCRPDGVNINDNCGSQHPQQLAAMVVDQQADVGLAFDGDADRLIAVDEKGIVLSGDQVMAICAREMHAGGQLTNDIVVTTVMSNMGLAKSLQSMGIRHLKAGVGDRNVMQMMRQNGAVLGGEDSGHIIFMNHHTTGDGMLAALMLLKTLQSSGKPLSELAKVMKVFPQCLINVDVQSKPELTTLPEIAKVIGQVEAELAGSGRVLVRYSGTQPQCRVMVEGPAEVQTEAFCKKIADVVTAVIG